MNLNTILNDDTVADLCTSCQMCAAVCPARAIKIELNEDGFYRPQIDIDKCINCGICKKNCYKYDKELFVSSEYKKAWACKAKDKEILENSTSGGVAYLLAEMALESGYKVLGVEYDNNKNRAIAQITDKDVNRFKGSKYIQAYTETAFSDLVKRIKNEKFVVFGLPCHIYAIDRMAREREVRENLILIDLFCHGCPSMLLWNANVKYMQEKMKVDIFDTVNFRSKKHGWHEFCESFTKGNNELVSKGGLTPFYQLFFSNHLLNEACNECKLRGTLAYTDIRLGDFWGREYDEDKEGVSAVVAVTEIGEKFLGKLSCDVFIKEHQLDEICKEQSYNKTYLVNNNIRKKILELSRSNNSIEMLVKEYIGMLPFSQKIKIYLKKIFSLIPQNIRFKVKKIVHSIR